MKNIHIARILSDKVLCFLESNKNWRKNARKTPIKNNVSIDYNLFTVKEINFTELSMKLSHIFNTSTTMPQAFTLLARWYNEVKKSGFESFKSVAKSIQTHYQTILNLRGCRCWTPS